MLDFLTYAIAVKKAKAYTDQCIDALPKGLVYRGAVNYQDNLPADAEVGDVYTVKYIGSTGQSPDGREYVWGSYNDVLQWILISGLTDIKNADGSTIVSEGIASIPFASSTTPGVVKVDGNTVGIDSNGRLCVGVTICNLPEEISGKTFNTTQALVTAANTALTNGHISASNSYYGGIYTGGIS